MKRLAAVILTCLITIPGVTWAQSFLPSSVVHAQASRSSSTPLESTLVQQDSNNVTVLGQNGNEGHYRGQAIDNGVQITSCGLAEFHLGVSTIGLTSSYRMRTPDRRTLFSSMIRAILPTRACYLGKTLSRSHR